MTAEISAATTGLLMGLCLAAGFLAGKFAALRRMSKWLGSLGESDQAMVRNLLRSKPPQTP